MNTIPKDAKTSPERKAPEQRAVTNEMKLAQARRELHDVLDEKFWKGAEIAMPHTLLNIEKLYNLYEAVCYVSERKIPGDFVECGVFKGGAIMMMAYTLTAHNYPLRRIHLFDTFAGFTGRTELDVDYVGREIGKYKTNSFRKEVESNLSKISYPSEHYVWVEGDVVQTSRSSHPKEISILRLDTDTYETTRAELENMFPYLASGGILIVDDYGYSKGCKAAVDEYFSTYRPRLFFQRAHRSSRTAVKI